MSEHDDTAPATPSTPATSPVTPPEPPRRVSVRRSPRYGVFLGAGTVLGLLAALVLTFAFDETQYGYTATLGYLAVALGLVGLLLGALAAVVAAAVLDRRSRPHG